MKMYQKEWVEEDRQRVMRMDQLYIEDGRHHKDHPKHGLYTGLHQEILIYEKWKKQKGE